MCVLQISQLEKTEGNKVWFPPFNFKVGRGEAKAIQCEREVGKQVMDILIGQVSSNGTIHYFGEVFNGNWKELAPQVGLVLWNDSLYGRLTAYEYLTFFKHLYAAETDIHQLLRKANLADKQRLKVSKLTFSEKKRLLFIKSIVQNPDLVLLEEPDQNIDLESKMVLRQLIDDLIEQKKAVLVITSNLESAVVMTDSVWRLNDSGIKRLDVLEEEEQKESNKEVSNRNQGQLPETELSSASFHAVNDSEKSEDGGNNQHRLDRIPAKVEDKLILFDPTEIDYIESNDGITYLHVKGEVFPCSFTLNDLDKKLTPFGFFRCHRSCIVNLQKVREVITWSRNSYSLILEDKKQSSIPLSKGRMNDLKDTLGL